jgi:hypothetical protein
VIEIKKFIQSLMDIKLENVFNPYTDTCPDHDLSVAAARRTEAVEKLIIQACRQETIYLWLARDLGYLGGRRTGLALTDDVHYPAHLQRWGIEASAPPCRGKPVKERTASVIWGELSRINSSVFLWNVFPFHPHEPLKPFSNRPHTAAERRIGLGILEILIELVRPTQIIAIGKDASRAAEPLRGDRPLFSVRHPSYGGAAIFRNQIREIARAT